VEKKNLYIKTGRKNKIRPVTPGKRRRINEKD